MVFPGPNEHRGCFGRRAHAQRDGPVRVHVQCVNLRQADVITDEHLRVFGDSASFDSTEGRPFFIEKVILVALHLSALGESNFDGAGDERAGENGAGVFGETAFKMGAGTPRVGFVGGERVFLVDDVLGLGRCHIKSGGLGNGDHFAIDSAGPGAMKTCLPSVLICRPTSRSSGETAATQMRMLARVRVKVIGSQNW